MERAIICKTQKAKKTGDLPHLGNSLGRWRRELELNETHRERRSQKGMKGVRGVRRRRKKIETNLAMNRKSRRR